VAKYRLYSEGYLVELMVELGYFGNFPRPAEPFLLNFNNFPTCKMLTETLDTLGVFTCGATNRCIGVLGAGQVDKFGNINSNWMSEKMYVTGSGGANDVAIGANESMVIMQQWRQRFLEKVPFITAPGGRTNILVSTMGVFEKLDGDNEFTLTKYSADRGDIPAESAIRKIKENYGWNLKVVKEPQKIPLPTLDELKLLRLFDPQKFYIK
jgi:acyl CoA:acetate/3-ketoacid CoA transferase beta subunit